MSSILTEDIIKSTVQTQEKHVEQQSTNFVPSYELIDFVDTKIGDFYTATIRDLVQRIINLEDEKVQQNETISDLKEMVMKLTEKQNSESNQDDGYITISRATRIYPELCKKGKLTTGEIKRICKIKHYSAVYRVCQKVVEMHPEECVYENGISGTGKKYLALKDYRGF